MRIWEWFSLPSCLIRTRVLGWLITRNASECVAYRKICFAARIKRNWIKPLEFASRETTVWFSFFYIFCCVVVLWKFGRNFECRFWGSSPSNLLKVSSISCGCYCLYLHFDIPVVPLGCGTFCAESCYIIENSVFSSSTFT